MPAVPRDGGNPGTARVLRLRAPGEVAVEPVSLRTPGPDEVLVRTRYSAVSRGTEALVFHGRVPPALYDTMRAPFQDGDFPGPLTYGYLNVGVVEQGPDGWPGRTVFCLYPHQTRYVVPVAAVVPVPDDVPAARAVLTGTVDTAVNALWDGAPLVGDRVAVIGAGMVGCCVARLLAGIPGIRLQLVDTDPSRAAVAAALGVDFAAPQQARDELDLVVHTSGTGAGLSRALELLGHEGEVLELSWFGEGDVGVALGSAFHPRRLAIRASQVGTVSPARRARRTGADRTALALRLLADPAFDALVTGESPFDDLPTVLPRLVSGALPALCHRIVYPDPED